MGTLIWLESNQMDTLICLDTLIGSDTSIWLKKNKEKTREKIQIFEKSTFSKRFFMARNFFFHDLFSRKELLWITKQNVIKKNPARDLIKKSIFSLVMLIIIYCYNIILYKNHLLLRNYTDLTQLHVTHTPTIRKSTRLQQYNLL